MPSTTAILNQVIFDYTLPAGAMMTYLRLAAMASESGGARLGPLDFDRGLLPRLGIKRSQAHEHLRQLRMAKLLYWVTDGSGYTIYLVGVAQHPDEAYPPSQAAEVEQVASPGISVGEKYGVGAVDGFVVENPVAFEPSPSADFTAQTARLDAMSGAADSFSAAPDCVDRDDSISGNFSDKNPQDKNHQHHLPAGKPDSRLVALKTQSPTHPQTPKLPEQLPPDPWSQEISRLSQDAIFTQVFGWLVQVGVWTDHAVQIARQISENEQRQQAYLPVRADVIGWIAFCFALGEKFGVKSPAHILSTNLRNKRLCPPALLPPRSCASCGRVEEWCECQEKSGFVFPDELIRLAQRNYYGQVEDFWDACGECHAIPCRCPDE